MKNGEADVYRLFDEQFDTRLSQVNSGWIFLGIWAVLIIVPRFFFFSEEIPLLPERLLGLAFYFVGWLAYPLVLVFVSRVTKVTPSVQRFALISVIVFITALALRPADHSTTDEWFAGIQLLGLVGIQFAGVRALRAAERQHDFYGTAFGTWFLFFFLPMFGIFFIHRRYRRLVEHSNSPNFKLEPTP